MNARTRHRTTYAHRRGARRARRRPAPPTSDVPTPSPHCRHRRAPPIDEVIAVDRTSTRRTTDEIRTHPHQRPRPQTGGIGRVVGSTATTVFVDIAHVGVVEYPRDQVEAMRFDRSIGEWGDFVPEVTS